MLMIREHLVRVTSDKVSDRGEGGYWCEVSHEALRDEVRQRSLWMYPMPGGFGQIVGVRHLFCPSCQADQVAPNESGAEPIYSMQLIDVDKYLMPTGLVSELELATRGMTRMEKKP